MPTYFLSLKIFGELDQFRRCEDWIHVAKLSDLCFDLFLFVKIQMFLDYWCRSRALCHAAGHSSSSSSSSSHCSGLSCSLSHIFDDLEAIAPPSPSCLSLDEPSDSSRSPSPNTGKLQQRTRSQNGLKNFLRQGLFNYFTTNVFAKEIRLTADG